MSQRILIRIFALLLAVFYQSVAMSATVELRPDLLPHLYDLRLIYSQPSSVDRDRSKIFFHRIGDKNSPQVIYFSGVIKKGDAEKFAQMYNGTDVYQKIVVFNSPGGNFAEGIRIGEVLREDLSGNDPRLNGVFVLKNDQCLSACAVAFSMAAVDPYEGRHGVSGGRFIEDGARVGFHMGILPDRLADQSVKINQALNLAYDVVAAFAQIIEDELSPARLLAEALKHRDADSFFEFSGDKTALSMGFNPVSRDVLASPISSAALNSDVALHICGRLMLSSHMRKSRFINEYLAYSSGAFIQNSKVNIQGQSSTLKLLLDELQTQTVGTLFEGGETCYLTISENGIVFIDVTGSGASLNCLDSSLNKDVEGWCASGPRASSSLVTLGLLADTMHCSDGQLQEDTSSKTDGVPWRRIIGQGVNMRDQPSISGQKIQTLERGMLIQVNDCKLVDDGQGVWYNITSDTHSGWISARFVINFVIW